MAEEAAIAKAETYSEMMHMSKQGIYDQLTSEYGEKFTGGAFSIIGRGTVAIGRIATSVIHVGE